MIKKIKIFFELLKGIIILLLYIMALLILIRIAISMFYYFFINKNSLDIVNKISKIIDIFRVSQNNNIDTNAILSLNIGILQGLIGLITIIAIIIGFFNLTKITNTLNETREEYNKTKKLSEQIHNEIENRLFQIKEITKDITDRRNGVFQDEPLSFDSNENNKFDDNKK